MSKFKSGQSGNPGGRPKGALNEATLATQALLDGEAEVLTRKVVELAKEGNQVALRLCLERLLPPRKDKLVQKPQFLSWIIPLLLIHLNQGLPQGSHGTFEGKSWHYREETLTGASRVRTRLPAKLRLSGR